MQRPAFQLGDFHHSLPGILQENSREQLYCTHTHKHTQKTHTQASPLPCAPSSYVLIYLYLQHHGK